MGNTDGSTAPPAYPKPGYWIQVVCRQCALARTPLPPGETGMRVGGRRVPSRQFGGHVAGGSNLELRTQTVHVWALAHHLDGCLGDLVEGRERLGVGLVSLLSHDHL
jgi:hypothetical protein